MLERILIAGSGGQGILFLGRLLAQSAVDTIPFITFFPAYGAEVRGGTCHSQVILSSDEITSPIAETFDSVIIMNQQSAGKFLAQLNEKGLAIINASLCNVKTDRRFVCVNATEMADQLGDLRVANLVMLGALLACKQLISSAAVEKALVLSLSGPKQALLDVNLQALHTGLSTAEG